MLSVTLGEGAELTSLEPWQAEDLAAHADRWREDFTPWLGWVRLVHDVDSARAFLQEYAERQAADTGRIYGIRLDGELVGGTVFRVFDAPQRSCEIGVWLSPPARGRGLVTRAAGAMIDWAFHARAMTRVEWLTDATNAPSIHVAKRLGMSYEGTMRKVKPEGERIDVQIWSLLAPEWRTERREAQD